MVQNLNNVGTTAGAEQHIQPDELNDGKTLSKDEYRPIWSVQSDKHTHYAPGYGVPMREGNAGFSDLDLQNGGGSAIEGKVRYEVYRDSNREELVAYGATYPLATLRSDVAQPKTDKTMIPLKRPGAGEDGYLVLAAKADASIDGDSVSTANSAVDVGMPYTQFTL